MRSLATHRPDAIQRFGMDPAEAFFVDDQAENVKGAARAGLTAIQLTDANALRSTLEGWGLLA
ncbi:MAG: hypothetical protein ABIP53_06055 [Candidatus Limnocylindrales bacterium]